MKVSRRRASVGKGKATRSAHTAKGCNPPAVSPDPKPTSSKPLTKIGVVTDMLRRGEGATVAEMMAATGWQAHSVRGVLSGTVRKKMGHTIVSQTTDHRGRVYRITAGEGCP